MARIVILGAGISGHTAALHLKRSLGREHQVIVVSPNSSWNWIPSNIWVGVGILGKEDVTFPLRPVYRRMGIDFKQARATAIYPEGTEPDPEPFVTVEYTDPEKAGQTEKVSYDYLINATGPKLNFAATPGLGPQGHSLSVCTYDHAEHAAAELRTAIERMRKGEQLTFVVGTGHGLCTCEGAAFEYVFNLEFELRQAGVRKNARLIFLTNEAELGDFGVGGMALQRGGYVIHSKVFAESLFAERGIEAITGTHVKQLEPGKIHYEQLDGTLNELAFDFAMLLPPFAGAGMKAFDRELREITSEVFAPSGFMKVDANYAQKPYEEWSPEDWPKTYQSPRHANVFAIGIAFAPPHPISKPMKSVNGTPITPSPPRTGMPSAIMGRVVAHSIRDMIREGGHKPTQRGSMADLGAGCIASAGANWYSGTAASMTMYPIVPDFKKYPETGRDLRYTFGEIGSAGHWIKQILHFMFMYKARALPFWWTIPE